MAGEGIERDHWSAAAVLVDHYPVEHAYAWRIDADGASLVISGDTAPYEPLAKAATGVDLLVHETWLAPKVEPARRYMSPEAAEAFIAKRNRYHTPSREVGRIARLADPKLLVLSHLGPVTAAEVSADVEKEWSRFVVGEDLLRFDVGKARLL
jgi:ribonuclease Z